MQAKIMSAAGSSVTGSIDAKPKNETQSAPSLFKLPDAARYLTVSESWMKHQADRAGIPYVRIGDKHKRWRKTNSINTSSEMCAVLGQGKNRNWKLAY